MKLSMLVQIPQNSIYKCLIDNNKAVNFNVSLGRFHFKESMTHTCFVEHDLLAVLVARQNLYKKGSIRK